MQKEFVYCTNCEQLIPFYESIEHKEGEVFDFLKLKFPFERLYILMKFEKKTLSQKLIHQLKYKKNEFFGQKIAEFCIERLNFDEEAFQKPDLVTYVPLHKKKQKLRGFNQNHLIASSLAKHYKIELEPEMLVRESHSSAQAKKNRVERLKTKNVFRLNKNLNCKHILLIDDVCTTGNTLSNCVWELLKIEGVRVSLLIIAKD